MEDAFNPNSLSINKLLTDSDALYQIPEFQRPYKWVDEQVDKLWDDLWESFENEEENYFLGSIITAKPENNKRYLDVIDGQQRLTTLIILFAVIRDRFPNINDERAQEDPSAIDLQQLKNAINYNDKFGRLRLVTHEQHRTDFDTLIIQEGNTQGIKKPKRRDLTKDEDPYYKFLNTAYLFDSKIAEISERECGDFVNFIFNQVKLIRIDCSNVSFAIKLFQVLNARGLDLSNADLIKSFLLSKVYKEYEEDEEIKEQKKNQFLNNWLEAENSATNTEERINDQLVLYQYYLLASNPKRTLYDELVKKFEQHDPLQVISDFKSFCKIYEDEIFNKDDKVIYSFFYLRWGVYWRTVLLSALHSNYPDYEDFKYALRRFYYLHWIAGYTLTKIKQISFNLIKWIKDKRPLNEIKMDLEKTLQENNVYSLVKESLKGEVYFNSWIKPLLFLIEYNATDGDQFLSMNDKSIHVDHILPQKFQNVRGWSHFIEGEVDGNEWLNTLGNLTLVSGKKNSSASNKPFDEKIEIYRGNGNPGSNNAKTTSIQLSQRLVNDFESSKYDKQWTLQAIIDRKNWFLTELEDIFEIDLNEIKSSKSGAL